MDKTLESGGGGGRGLLDGLTIEQADRGEAKIVCVWVCE